MMLESDLTLVVARSLTKTNFASIRLVAIARPPLERVTSDLEHSRTVRVAHICFGRHHIAWT